jgi:hypothetical protein
MTPMRVKFGTAGSEVDLGGTLSNVVVKTEFSKGEIKADQFGDSVLDRRVSGLMLSVTTEIAEVQLKDNWKVVLPHAKLVDGGGGNKSIYLQSMVGDSDLANAKQLLLHPLSKADSDKSGDLLIYKACAVAVTEIPFGPKTQAALKIVWNALLDTSISPARLALYGDPAIGLVAASAGSPSFVGTGNGTLTGVAVYTGITVSETITATCVHAVANGGVFNVNGSISGPLGLATVGIGFNASNPQVISFTINDGTSDFVVGDAFTIVTTGGNYA